MKPIPTNPDVKRVALFQPTIAAPSTKDFRHLDPSPLDNIYDAKIPDPQPIKNHPAVPAAVLDVRSWTWSEWIRLQFPKASQNPVARTNFEGPEKKKRFVGKKELKLL
jgi:hypothetical protein